MTPLRTRPRPSRDDTFSPRHMAVVRFSSLGDVALLTGVLLYWQAQLGTRFVVITRESFAPLFDGHPAVDEVCALAPDDMHGVDQVRLFRELARRYPSLPLVDVHGTLRTRLLKLVWNGPTHTYPKYSLARRVFLRTNGRFCRNALLRATVPQRYAQALPGAQASLPEAEQVTPRFFLTASEQEGADTQLAFLPSYPDTPLVALHPFATHPAKTWPLARWVELSRLLEERGIPFIWVGHNSTNSLPPGPANLINRTDVRQLLAILARVSVLITGDSGPMHLASGVDTPVLALFGPTTQEWGFFPSGARNVILQRERRCRPCSLHGNTACPYGNPCLGEISPADVVESLLPMVTPSNAGSPA